MELNKTVHKVLENFDLKLTDDEVKKYYFKKKTSFDTQYSFIILPFFKIYPYVLILVSNEEKQATSGRLHKGFERGPILEGFPSFDFEIVVSYLSDMVVDLFLDLPTYEMLSIIESMAEECGRVFTTFIDPRVQVYLNDDHKKESLLDNPDYTLYTELEEIPDLYISALNESLGETVGLLYKMVGEMNYICNELEAIESAVEHIEMAKEIVKRIKSRIKYEIRDFDNTFYNGVFKKSPTSTQDDFDYYLYVLVEKAILDKE